MAHAPLIIVLILLAGCAINRPEEAIYYQCKIGIDVNISDFGDFIDTPYDNLLLKLKCEELNGQKRN